MNSKIWKYKIRDKNAKRSVLLRRSCLAGNQPRKYKVVQFKEYRKTKGTNTIKQKDKKERKTNTIFTAKKFFALLQQIAY